ncbi:peptidylprolyl isomerase [Flavobacterium sp. XGLA_31]|uniref:peptidylprolyl isomerase n=1 Tax=Flavobacterium sp. XGLA_31 TaxID=3447666 RepID=UPI003F2E26C7
MNKKIALFFALVAFALTSCKDEHKNLKDGLYAEIETPKGNILLELKYQQAPVTVANFVTLAEGKNPFVMEDLKGKPFYDGIVFHRVEKGFVIQGGDPLGNGSGDPGYTFADEFTELKHNRPGTLSMANSGPNTNGSQFFITFEATPNLDGRHAVFGYVVEGMDVVNSIEVNDPMTKVTIIRKGEAVKKFDAVKIFTDAFKTNQEKIKLQAGLEAENNKKLQELEAKKAEEYKAKYGNVIAAKLKYFNSLKATATKSTTGLAYKTIRKSTGEKPKDGTTFFINYAGFLEDGTLFDTSDIAVAKQFGTFDTQRAMQNGYTLLPFKVGGYNQLIPGFVEAIGKMKVGDKAVLFIPAALGYGEQGAGGVIPPNANLIFEVEIRDKK